MEKLDRNQYIIGQGLYFKDKSGDWQIVNSDHLFVSRAFAPKSFLNPETLDFYLNISSDKRLYWCDVVFDCSDTNDTVLNYQVVVDATANEIEKLNQKSIKFFKKCMDRYFEKYK